MLELSQEVAIRRSPYQEQPIFTAAGNERAIGGPYGSIDRSGLFTSHPAGAFLHIPKTDAAIKAAAGKKAPIETPVHTDYQIGMALQDMRAGARLSIPDAHRLIRTPTGDAVSSAAPGDCVHLAPMPSQDLHRCLGGHIPEGERRLTAATQQEAPIGTPGQS